MMICYVSTIRSETHKLCSAIPPIQSKLRIFRLEGRILKRNMLTTFNGSFSNTSHVDALFLNIQVINIANATAKEIEDETFLQFVCLSDLNLSYNQIENLTSKTFGNLTELKTLNLSVNWIRNISVQVFSGLKSLKILDLSYNKISFLDNKSLFVQNVQLEYLSFSYNLIRRISPMFNSLIRLKQLLLDHCSLAMFKTVWMRNNTVLEKLDISSNQMVSLVIELHTFNKTAMQLWNISNNCLTRVSFDNLALEFSNSATIIDLSNNQFNCSNWLDHLNNFKTNNINFAPMRNASGGKIKTWNCSNKNVPQIPTNVFSPSLIIVCFVIVSMFVVLFVIDYRAKLGYRQRLIHKIRQCFVDKPLERENSYNPLRAEF